MPCIVRFGTLGAWGLARSPRAGVWGRVALPHLMGAGCLLVGSKIRPCFRCIWYVEWAGFSMPEGFSIYPGGVGKLAHYPA